MGEDKLKDPRKMYYTEKFPDQEQDTPALQERMDPKPDSGEESYKGYNRLEGKIGRASCRERV